MQVSILKQNSSRVLINTNFASLTPNADTVLSTERWWWQRLVLGLWMLMTLVLAKSYSGNLMSLLAVRHVPQPFQTPMDVLNDPGVAMIWQKYSRNEQFLRVSSMSCKGVLGHETQPLLFYDFNPITGSMLRGSALGEELRQSQLIAMVITCNRRVAWRHSQPSPYTFDVSLRLGTVSNCLKL